MYPSTLEKDFFQMELLFLSTHISSFYTFKLVLMVYLDHNLFKWTYEPKQHWVL